MFLTDDQILLYNHNKKMMHSRRGWGQKEKLIKKKSYL